MKVCVYVCMFSISAFEIYVISIIVIYIIYIYRKLQKGMLCYIVTLCFNPMNFVAVGNMLCMYTI